MWEGKAATLYRDPRYAFGVCHAVGTIRKLCEFLMSVGPPPANEHVIVALL